MVNYFDNKLLRYCFYRCRNKKYSIYVDFVIFRIWINIRFEILPTIVSRTFQLFFFFFLRGEGRLSLTDIIQLVQGGNTTTSRIANFIIFT